MPRVVNRHHGRPPPGAIYIGRGTPLGNPYKVTSTCTREQAIECYREWLDERLGMEDEVVWAALRAIKRDSVLVCSCKPAPCHGDVVVDVWAREFGEAEQMGLL